MQKPKKPLTTPRSLDILAAMQEAASSQFQAATLLAISVAMKKIGITDLTIEPEDLKSIVAGEKLHVLRTVSGGITYTFQEPSKVN